MILHYLKVAVRSLMKYKMQSLISALCLAVGIVCFSYTYLAMEILYPMQNLSQAERRVNLKFGEQGHTAITSMEEYAQVVEELRHIGVKQSAAFTPFTNLEEINLVDEEGKETPCMLHTRYVYGDFFRYFEMPVQGLRDDKQGPYDVILSQQFAQRIWGDKNPVGQTLRFADDKSAQLYQVVGTVDDRVSSMSADCYFATDLETKRKVIDLVCLMPERMKSSDFLSALKKITLKQGSVEVPVFGQLESERIREQIKSRLLAQTVASLILLSALINFLKFIIQMFYSRQRSLALRKCLGSRYSGLYGLLAAEVFLMMTLALFFSLVLTEVVVVVPINVIQLFMGTSIEQGALFLNQIEVYAVTLMISLLVITIPLLRLRRLSVYNFLQRCRRKHFFRNMMIGVQLVISMFFLGAVLMVMVAWKAFQPNPILEPFSFEEQERIVMVPVNTEWMRTHLTPIITKIYELPEVEEVIHLSESYSMYTPSGCSYSLKDGRTRSVKIQEGDPKYFTFCHIPLEGKVLSSDTKGQIYVSEAFKQVLDREGNMGTVEVMGNNYQIAGVYKALYGEEEDKGTDGSIFIPSDDVGTYCIKVSRTADVAEVISQLTATCREFVPETLPLYLHSFADEMGMFDAFRLQSIFMGTLAGITLLLVVLSVFSAISMDTVERQKEVAIRKINGASPMIIAYLFGRSYLFIFLVAYLLACALLIVIGENMWNLRSDTLPVWAWMLFLFVAVGGLMCLTTAYKIWQVMRLNPAEVIKRE